MNKQGPTAFEVIMQATQSQGMNGRAAPLVSQIANEPTEHITETLDRLSLTDVTVHYLRKIAAIQGWSETEMYQRMVVALGQEKQYLERVAAGLMQEQTQIFSPIANAEEN